MEVILVESEERGQISVPTMVLRPCNLLGPKLMAVLAGAFEAAKAAGSRAIVLRTGVRHLDAGADPAPGVVTES
jgi:enoyl-CoA hydratase/carnithine racemase